MVDNSNDVRFLLGAVVGRLLPEGGDVVDEVLEARAPRPTSNARRRQPGGGGHEQGLRGVVARCGALLTLCFLQIRRAEGSEGSVGLPRSPSPGGIA